MSALAARVLRARCAGGATNSSAHEEVSGPRGGGARDGGGVTPRLARIALATTEEEEHDALGNRSFIRETVRLKPDPNVFNVLEEPHAPFADCREGAIVVRRTAGVLRPATSPLAPSTIFHRGPSERQWSRPAGATLCWAAESQPALRPFVGSDGFRGTSETTARPCSTEAFRKARTISWTS